MADARRRAAADSFPYLLLVDEQRRPVGWIDDRVLATAEALRDADAVAESPLFEGHTTLRDALSMLLEAGVQAGIVVDAVGAVAGLLTVEMILERTNTR